MWSGGISGRNRVRPAGKWAKVLTCQTAKTPACHIQFVMPFVFLHFCFIALVSHTYLQFLAYARHVRIANVYGFRVG